MLKSLRQRPEVSRRRIAFFTSLSVSLFILSGWLYTKGFFGYSSEVVVKKETEKLAETDSPLRNTKSVLSSAFGQISEEYETIKESLSSVIVPFITGIDIYNKEKTE